MKTINLFALLISSALLFSCGGEDDATPAGNSISANVTGDVTANFSASGEMQGQKLVRAPLTNTSSGDVLAVIGTDINGSSMNLTINQYEGAGTYDLNITSVNNATYTSVEIDGQTITTTAITAISGSVEITVNGDVINGTFEFDAEGPDEIQADVTGQFSVTAEEQ